jgi:division protein CdvB (Snf7/Vps24/ESCRT-III family)
MDRSAGQEQLAGGGRMNNHQDKVAKCIARMATLTAKLMVERVVSSQVKNGVRNLADVFEELRRLPDPREQISEALARELLIELMGLPRVKK